MTLNERKNRIIVRGEVTDHSHIITGDAEITRNSSGEILIEVGSEGALLRHLLESRWLEGEEVWTKEHEDIKVDPGSYKFIQQVEYDPYEDIIRDIRD